MPRPKTLTQGERADFRQFCDNASESQLREIWRRENDARRFDYAGIARDSASARSIDLGGRA